MLASASPRRADLLGAAGFSFEICVADVDERLVAGEAAEAYVGRLASEKSARVQTTLADKGTVVLGADTAVVVDGDILGKPVDARDAERMLRRLSGRSHDVLTGVSLRRDHLELRSVETSRVVFATLSPAELDWYGQSGEGLDKAGAYAVQGLASRFITRIEGSYSNVVGLPVATVYRLWCELASSG